MQIINHIETERLILRSWIDEDAEIFAEINQDPRVIEFLRGPLNLRTCPKSFLPNKQQPHKRQFNHCERGGELSLAVLPKSSAFF